MPRVSATSKVPVSRRARAAQQQHQQQQPSAYIRVIDDEATKKVYSDVTVSSFC
jgi:hypothetical protein